MFSREVVKLEGVIDVIGLRELGLTKLGVATSIVAPDVSKEKTFEENTFLLLGQSHMVDKLY